VTKQELNLLQLSSSLMTEASTGSTEVIWSDHVEAAIQSGSGGWPDHDPKHKGCPVHDCSIVMSGMRVSGLSVILATPQMPFMVKQRP